MTQKEKSILSDVNKDEVLKNFMEEFFDFDALCEVGFFKKEWKNDYKAQADRVCKFMGLKTIYEYRSETISCHLSYAGNHRPEGEGFITVIDGIYD